MQRQIMLNRNQIGVYINFHSNFATVKQFSMIKKLITVLLIGMLMCTSFADAKVYKAKHSEDAAPPRRAPALCFISMNLDEDTGELIICPSYDVAGLQVVITGDGITYLDTTVSLSAGEVYLDSLEGYATGEYTLTLSTTDGVTDQYVITVEPD